MAKIVRLVALQFMVSEKFLRATPEILSGVLLKEPEPLEAREIRKERDYKHQEVNMVLPPTKKVGLEQILPDLETSGYVLVGAKRQTRKNDRGGWDHIFRYIFVRKEFVSVSPEFFEKRPEILFGLRILCERNMWRSQGFANPFFANGEPVEGHLAVDFNLKEREGLLDENDLPIMVWQKDENGRRVGESKIPLRPEFTLNLKDSLRVLEQ